MNKEINELAELFWQFHNDRLADPNLTEMKPYIQPILNLLKEQKLQLLEEVEGSVMGAIPKKKNLAYRQGRELPVLSGIEEKDPPHVKAKKYINYGHNQAIEKIRTQIIKSIKELGGKL